MTRQGRVTLSPSAYNQILRGKEEKKGGGKFEKGIKF
jgi:hypothetical protein